MLLLPLLFLGRLQAQYVGNIDFTLGERLLTQSRVLWDYLTALVLPATAAVGIFHDIEVSTSLFSPPLTFVAILAWAALIALAIARPGRQRIWLFALGWFWSGHMIESTVLPLEL